MSLQGSIETAKKNDNRSWGHLTVMTSFCQARRVTIFIQKTFPSWREKLGQGRGGFDWNAYGCITH